MNEIWWAIIVAMTAVGFFCVGYLWGGRENLAAFKRGWEQVAERYTKAIQDRPS